MFENSDVQAFLSFRPDVDLQDKAINGEVTIDSLKRAIVHAVPDVELFGSSGLYLHPLA